MTLAGPVRQGSRGPEVSVIVPARNEEACLARCLGSLIAQTGIEFEIVVVDDHSTDQTRQIAQQPFVNSCAPEVDVSEGPVIRVVDAPDLPPGWYGKANACAAGAKVSRGEWLLFTDADTTHQPGSLARAIAEAKEHGVNLLSYSPAQEVHGIMQCALMPVIFAELAVTYKPKQVSDPASRSAAANGQYLLIRREAYDSIGGHAAIATDLLEDVALARRVKQSGKRLRFRFGGDAVSTRMYRTWRQMREGWTKNLVLLFPRASSLALLRLLEFVASAGAVTAALTAIASGAWTYGVVAAIVAVPT